MAVDIISTVQTLIDSIRDTAAITSITHTGTTYTINTADTKRLAVNQWVRIGTTNYKIVTLTTNVSFTIVSSSNVVGSIWTALAPYYFYGTPKQISNTLSKLSDSETKYPIIALMETMPATVNNDETQPIERTVSLEMFFGDLCNPPDWDSEDYYTNVIDKMQVYIDSFIDACENSSLVTLPDTHSETPYSRWNMTLTATGANVFNENLSGIMLSIDLEFMRSLACDE